MPFPAWVTSTEHWWVNSREHRSVVTIKTYDEDGDALGIGSGFVVTRDGLVATNVHVIKDAAIARVHLTNGDVFRVAGVLEFDGNRDFAILKIPAVELPALPIGNADRLASGDALSQSRSGEPCTTERAILRH
jgi:S1-C subfamily serine protease